MQTEPINKITNEKKDKASYWQTKHIEYLVVVVSGFTLFIVHYGITGYGVSRPGIQNKKDFCIKINIPKENYWILRILELWNLEL